MSSSSKAPPSSSLSPSSMPSPSNKANHDDGAGTTTGNGFPNTLAPSPQPTTTNGLESSATTPTTATPTSGTKRPAPTPSPSSEAVEEGGQPPASKRQNIEGRSLASSTPPTTTTTGASAAAAAASAAAPAARAPAVATASAKPAKVSNTNSKTKASSSTPRSSPSSTVNKTTSKSTTTTNTPKSTTSSTSAAVNNRGLRHFSMMVCQKVEEKGTTTYNEVADELVSRVIAERRKEDPNGKFDEKNIRRRVYDALNVLMAMDIISKEKKEITWQGLPAAGDKQDMESLQHEIEYRRYQLQHKKEALKEVLTQQVCFRNLVLRNHENEERQRQRLSTQQHQQPQDVAAGAAATATCPSSSSTTTTRTSTASTQPEDKIPLPFIVVNTNASAVIQCDMSRDRTDVMFDFSMPFEINDDNTILKKLGMNQTSLSTLRQMLPEDLFRYCQSNHLIDSVIGQNDIGHEDDVVAAADNDVANAASVDPIPIGTVGTSTRRSVAAAASAGSK